MPIQEFRCRGCNQDFEIVYTGKTVPEASCPSCSSSELDRLIGLPGATPAATAMPTNCRGDGPPCGAPGCGRGRR